MKTFTLLCIFVCSASFLQAQAGPSEPDTLIQEFFNFDPTPVMLPAPTGDDDNWVNYDTDQAPTLCVLNLPTPFGWYWESDLGHAVPDESNNFAFTSCSWVDRQISNETNRNWLIIRAITIPDSNYALAWRSLPFQGPMYMDGYKVLLSTNSNDPASGDFTDTLFQAAEMISGINGIGSLDPADYNFSPGYIHASSFTDTTYYFLDETEPSAPIYRGKLEPHTVSLKNYAGHSVYIAFLHDSEDDNLIQVDDILVANTITVGTKEADSGIQDFQIIGNPTRGNTYFTWNLNTAREASLVIANQQGQLMLDRKFGRQQQNNWFCNTEHWAPGIYYCTLRTSTGISNLRLVRI